LQVHNQLRKQIHPLDELAHIAGAALLDVEVVTDFPGGGDEILAVFSGQLKQVIARELAPTFLVISEWIWKTQILLKTTSYTHAVVQVSRTYP
jgi:hypothetical protein